MQLLEKSKLNPVVSFVEFPEKFILEHCGNLGGNLEERVLDFLRKLVKHKIHVPQLNLNEFPKSIHSKKLKEAIEYFEKQNKKQVA